MAKTTEGGKVAKPKAEKAAAAPKAPKAAKAPKAEKSAKVASAPKASLKAAQPKKGGGSTQPVTGTVKVTQLIGCIGRRHDQEATLIGLGLNKRHRSRVLEDNPAVRGMIYKVRHLVKVEKVS